LLKLKKVQLLGFKSFCDRTEVQLAGSGIAVVVGPNGCGKSNISDAINWVLGEQSAKSLRGLKMEDVIFAGTRDRKPTGMAEVSLTLIDPDLYDGATLAEGETEVVVDGESTSVKTTEISSDWDEAALRAHAAEETEEAVTEAQPGTTYEAHVPAAKLAEAEAAASETPADSVVLKIRRRKFGRAPVRAGEITVTRRLFRSGDSEYLLNGKICRLRDIQDIFMGTGLGGESYAMISQERIGSILSAKPLERRAIIEEAAGITRFKTKKRLAELRLESARQNLSRVNDIFEEVTRQMGVLKRQASKAERYATLREELRGKLRIVLSSRLVVMDAEQASLASEIARLAAVIETQALALNTMDADHSAGVTRGYGLDEQIRAAGARANHAAVELERIAARTAANHDRVAELTERMATANTDLAEARAQIELLSAEREQHRSFLESATAEFTTQRDASTAAQTQAQEATRKVIEAEAAIETHRHTALQAMQRATNAAQEIAQAEAALAGLDRERERLETESAAARADLESLGSQRGQAQLTFESVIERLERLVAEIAELRRTLEEKRSEETQSRRRGDELRAEMATLLGRRSSLESLIREHSYSTETVRDIFRANANRAQQSSPHGLAPIGTLADFLEVDGQYEQVVDEFLRDELNYIVVKSWDAANEGMRMLQSDVAGRATFLVHPNDAQAAFPFAEGMKSSSTHTREGVVALKDCVRVLDGFGRSLEVILPRLREGFIVPDDSTGRSLALSNPQSFFLSPSGETFHNVTVTGGRQREQGPLALKRELAELQSKLEAVEAELSKSEIASAAVSRHIAELTATLDHKDAERRDAERESANSGAALRQMESETARLEARLQQWQIAAGRNNDQRQSHQERIGTKRDESAALEAERVAIAQKVDALSESIVALRLTREELQTAAAAAAAALAGLEERRRNADANFERTNRLFDSQQQRINQLDASISSSVAEKQRREEETAELDTQHITHTESRAQAISESETLTAEATALRAAMAELDTKLRALRHAIEELREQRSTLTARTAKLTSDLEHLEQTCLNDLAVEAASLRTDETIVRIEGEILAAEEEAARAIKQRLEAMGPVNMMALEEFKETAERHAFLEAQRKDLIDSIENTAASIKEIDEISREKFDEAFKAINENFAHTFSKLFGGGQAFLRLSEPDSDGKQDNSGIDIIASPPGKKLQNVLLLSGGEKALTALALLVGVFQFQPAPFCVLDEVDAPLDETNVGRFARLISELAETTQFVVITHSKRTMEQADVMYGVTMQEPGVSKIVSVSLSGRSTGKESRAAA